MGTEHVLLGLLAEPDGIAGQVLWRLGVAEDAKAEVERVLRSEDYHRPSRTLYE